MFFYYKTRKGKIKNVLFDTENVNVFDSYKAPERSWSTYCEGMQMFFRKKYSHCDLLGAP